MPTEPTTDLLRCPFCGDKPDITKHFKHAIWRLDHRRKVIGTIIIDWHGNVEALAAIWNRRAP